MKAVPEWRGVDASLFRAEIEPLNRPAVLRGLVDHWPAVKCARESPQALADYLNRHCNDKPVSTFMAEPPVTSTTAIPADPSRNTVYQALTCSSVSKRLQYDARSVRPL
jgi:hypothetical protein